MSLRVCKFYSQNQTCRFGKNCRFSHSSQRPPPDRYQNHSVHDEVSSVSSACPTPAEPASTLNPNEIDSSNSTRNDEVSVSSGSQASSRRIDLSSRPNSFANKGSQRQQNNDAANQGNIPICRYFARGGRCYYGRNCRFLHKRNAEYQPQRVDTQSIIEPAEQPDHPRSSNEVDQVNISDTAKKHSNVKGQAQGRSGQTKPRNGGAGTERKVCPFYLARRCNRGRRCKFLHVGPSTSDENVNYIGKEDESIQDGLEKLDIERTQKKRDNPPPRSGVFKQIYTIAEQKEVGASILREGEVNTIKKRFPADKISIIDDAEGKFSARINFSPSDPDWPFDVKVFELMLSVPPNYPIETLSVKLPTDQNMPETVRRYVELTIQDWLNERNSSMAKRMKVELVFRSFLRWLDRSLEEITTEALKQLKRELVAKAAGLEFYSPAQLREKLEAEASDSGDDDIDGNEDSEDEGYDLSSSDDDDEEEEDAGQQLMGLPLDPEKKGTQIELRHLQLKENTSAVLFDRLKIVLQCGRCKTHSDLVVPQAQVMSLTCIKCNQSQYVHFRAALAHQFSSVIGYLDLDGCTAFDLVLPECRAVVTCMGCSKLTRIDGLVSGQMVDGWCQACNAKFRLATEAVKFAQLAVSGVDKGNSKKIEVDVGKKRRPLKEPGIREGYPLPEFGTCKHYKHSYRWLRFPCCGKAYPCDVCHDKKEDHEFIYATRMICGHCCKEQNFAASRPCNSCSQHMTKTRSAHWEGGKGCRDKISMSKNDQQKYRNLSKTQSNHKKQLQSGGKKNTKLRHS